MGLQEIEIGPWTPDHGPWTLDLRLEIMVIGLLTLNIRKIAPCTYFLKTCFLQCCIVAVAELHQCNGSDDNDNEMKEYFLQ